MLDNMQEEEWKIIEDFPDYQVSTLGRVKGGRWGHIKKLSENTYGYKIISLYDTSKRRITKSVHRLVASTFIPNPENKPCIDHINRVRDDNRICNLRWVTHKENEDNKERGVLGEKYIHLHKSKRHITQYYRVTLENRPIFKTLEEAIAYRDTILNQTPASPSTFLTYSSSLTSL